MCVLCLLSYSASLDDTLEYVATESRSRSLSDTVIVCVSIGAVGVIATIVITVVYDERTSPECDTECDTYIPNTPPVLGPPLPVTFFPLESLPSLPRLMGSALVVSKVRSSGDSAERV
jgi:hypothetical protein